MLTFLSGVLRVVLLMLLDNAFLLSAVSAILDDQHSLRAPHETVNPSTGVPLINKLNEFLKTFLRCFFTFKAILTY